MSRRAETYARARAENRPNRRTHSVPVVTIPPQFSLQAPAPLAGGTACKRMLLQARTVRVARGQAAMLVMLRGCAQRAGYG